jgi:hypothetical protein
VFLILSFTEPSVLCPSTYVVRSAFYRRPLSSAVTLHPAPPSSVQHRSRPRFIAVVRPAPRSSAFLSPSSVQRRSRPRFIAVVRPLAPSSVLQPRRPSCTSEFHPPAPKSKLQPRCRPAPPSSVLHHRRPSSTTAVHPPPLSSVLHHSLPSSTAALRSPPPSTLPRCCLRQSVPPPAPSILSVHRHPRIDAFKLHIGCCSLLNGFALSTSCHRILQRNY